MNKATKFLSMFSLLLFVIAVSSCGSGDDTQVSDNSAYDFLIRDIRNDVLDLNEFKGEKVALFVNTASECGLTPQFIKLQELYDTYKDQGFVVIGFPSNTFEQEPRTDSEILTFCTDNYLVSFPLTKTINVNPPDQFSVYSFLTDPELNPEFSGEITWNFEKFLIDRDGNVIGRYKPEIEPDDPELIQAIESVL